MFSSTVLEIIIILVFIFLIYSLLVTIVVESIASIFRLRSKTLRAGIMRMLQDEEELNIFKGYVRNLWRGIRRLFDRKAYEGNFVQDFFNRPSIKYLGKGNTQQNPSYIEPVAFSKTILDLLKRENGATDGDRIKKALGYHELVDQKITFSMQEWTEFEESFLGEDPTAKAEALLFWENQFKVKEPIKQVEFSLEELDKHLKMTEGMSADQKFQAWKNWTNNNQPGMRIDPETRLHLCSLWRDSNESEENFQVLLEDWFNQSMDRVKGWYKKRISRLTFFVGFCVAVSFNLDTIDIVKTLQKDTAIREALIVQVDAYAKKNPESTTIDSLKSSAMTAFTGINDVLASGKPRLDNKGCKGKGLAFLGWLITALAISLGAPFWFDLLNKLINLRTSLKNKNETKESSEPITGKKGAQPARKIHG